MPCTSTTSRRSGNGVRKALDWVRRVDSAPRRKETDARLQQGQREDVEKIVDQRLKGYVSYKWFGTTILAAVAAVAVILIRTTDAIWNLAGALRELTELLDK